MRSKKKRLIGAEMDIVIPDNIEVVFEHYCRGCDKCEPAIIEGQKYRLICINTQICSKARSIAATEKAKEFPFV